MVKDLKSSGILGIMSGTSLDGLDMAFCYFSRNESVWKFSIEKAATIPYPSGLAYSLENAIRMTGVELIKLDHTYGKWIGGESKKFLTQYKLRPDFIASHGHTVFHQPTEGFTLQIGNGHDIRTVTGIPVICDFRGGDLALGGNGAPLVPAGDEYLFGDYSYCLNLGGFSNISFRKDNKRIAFDICPVNMGLNFLAGKTGQFYDKDGETGRKGKIIPLLLERLNKLDYYKLDAPKSLGREWFLKYMEPYLNEHKDINNTLRTLYEHIAIQISYTLNKHPNGNLLVTGGGAKNKFLMELIEQKTYCKIVIPDYELIDFKEAMIFAFLAYLRINGINNVFSSVTGASGDHSAGVIYY